MKIGFFITARLKSSRLKEKILLDLNGATVLDRVIERCKKVHGIDDVVLCTSTNKQDSHLYDFALKNNIKFFMGSEEDVLERLLGAAEYYGFDGFLSITADNPLHSFYIGEILVDFYRDKRPDFIFTKGLPIGIAPYFLDTKALKIACEMKRNDKTEIWGPFVDRPDFFKIGRLNIQNSKYNETTRLTCDYPEDYKLFRSLYNNFKKNDLPSIQSIFDILEKDENLLEINKMHSQLWNDQEAIDKIRNVFNENIKLGSKLAEKLNKHLIAGEEILNLEI